jgi:hypothetical protein
MINNKKIKFMMHMVLKMVLIKEDKIMKVNGKIKLLVLIRKIIHLKIVIFETFILLIIFFYIFIILF